MTTWIANPYYFISFTSSKSYEFKINDEIWNMIGRIPFKLIPKLLYYIYSKICGIFIVYLSLCNFLFNLILKLLSSNCDFKFL